MFTQTSFFFSGEGDDEQKQLLLTGALSKKEVLFFCLSHYFEWLLEELAWESPLWTGNYFLLRRLMLHSSEMLNQLGEKYFYESFFPL